MIAPPRYTVLAVAPPQEREGCILIECSTHAGARVHVAFSPRLWAAVAQWATGESGHPESGQPNGEGAKRTKRLVPSERVRAAVEAALAHTRRPGFTRWRHGELAQWPATWGLEPSEWGDFDLAYRAAVARERDRATR